MDCRVKPGNDDADASHVFVAHLPVNNRPETGSPPPRPFSTSAGWSFSAQARDLISFGQPVPALSCPHAEEPRLKRVHARLQRAMRGVSKHEGTRRPILRDGAIARRKTRVNALQAPPQDEAAYPRAEFDGPSPSRFRHPSSLFKQPISFPRRISAPGFLPLCFAKPLSRGSGAPIRRTHIPTSPQVAPGYFRHLAFFSCAPLTPPLPSSG